MALTLRLLGGLTTDEIARAFLVPEPTIAQRIVRAKRTLAEAQVPFEVPRGRRARRPAVVGARGHLPDFQRGLLGHRRRRLDAAGALRGRAPAGPHPGRARAGRAGGPRPGGADGDPGFACAGPGGPIGRADPAARSGPRALGPPPHPPRPRGARAREQLGGALGPTRCRPRSPPATRGRAPPEETDWARIAALYDALAQLTPSPVVELNRAVAVGMAFGPAAGLELVDALLREPALKSYHLLPSVRGDLLAKLGRFDEARAGVRAGRLAHPQRAGAEPAAGAGGGLRRRAYRRMRALRGPPGSRALS